MALALNKSSLKLQRDQLKMFRRFLPSLDLKRQQLLAALKEARHELAAAQRDVDALNNVNQATNIVEAKEVVLGFQNQLLETIILWLKRVTILLEMEQEQVEGLLVLGHQAFVLQMEY